MSCGELWKPAMKTYLTRKQILERAQALHREIAEFILKRW